MTAAAPQEKIIYARDILRPALEVLGFKDFSCPTSIISIDPSKRDAGSLDFITRGIDLTSDLASSGNSRGAAEISVRNKFLCQLRATPTQENRLVLPVNDNEIAIALARSETNFTFKFQANVKLAALAGAVDKAIGSSHALTPYIIYNNDVPCPEWGTRSLVIVIRFFGDEIPDKFWQISPEDLAEDLKQNFKPLDLIRQRFYQSPLGIDSIDAEDRVSYVAMVNQRTAPAAALRG